MAYRFRFRESVAANARRVVREQLVRAVGEVLGASADKPDGVHEARKRLKKIRAVVRILEPALGERAKEGAAPFRAAQRSISLTRDAQALLECVDALAAAGEAQARERLAPLREALAARAAEVHEDPEAFREALDRAREHLLEGVRVVDAFDLEGADWRDVLEGASATYGRARRAMKEVRDEPTGERCHEWRKRTKDHLHQLALLRDLWRPVLSAFTGELSQVAGALGDEHDLQLLVAVLRDEAARFEGLQDPSGAPLVPAVLERAAARRVELREAALERGRLLFAEKPKRLRRRLEAWLAASTGR